MSRSLRVRRACAELSSRTTTIRREDWHIWSVRKYRVWKCSAEAHSSSPSVESTPRLWHTWPRSLEDGDGSYGCPPSTRKIRCGTRKKIGHLSASPVMVNCYRR